MQCILKVGVSDTPFCHIMRMLLHCFAQLSELSLMVAINLLAYKNRSLIRTFSSLLGVKSAVFRNKIMRGMATALHHRYCNVHTGYLQLCLSGSTDACSIVCDALNVLSKA